jgi:CrcB protein
VPDDRNDPPLDDDVYGLDPELEPAFDPSHHARPTLAHGLTVLAGGAIGTLARDLLLRAAPAAHLGFPWMLVSLNLVGAAALGLLVARVLDPHPHRVELRLFLATGILGGFTTYSSLVSASIVLGHNGHLATGFATMLGTSLAGVAAAWAGSRRRSQAVPA